MTIAYREELKQLAHEVLMGAAKPYTEAQLKEIPNILNVKHRYFLGNDLNDWDLLRDVFTEEGEHGFRAFWNGAPGATNIEDQIAAVVGSIGPQENLVPTHYGHNQVVCFIDDTHARVLTRMHDRHEYCDDGEVYAGWGIYIDDMLKCKDGVWRMETLRLDYCQMQGSLRCTRQ